MPSKARLLLVDDSPTDTKLLEVAIRQSDWISLVHTASDGQQALDYLASIQQASERPNLIFLDLNMPRMNGFELLKILKSDPILRAIPVVVLTTSSSPKDVRESYSQHANSFMTKPPDFPGFVKALGILEEFWTQVATLPPDLD